MVEQVVFSTRETEVRYFMYMALVEIGAWLIAVGSVVGAFAKLGGGLIELFS